MDFPCTLSQPSHWQEELEFAAMRIEALKLARQITLSSFNSLDTEVSPVPAVCVLKNRVAAFTLTISFSEW